MFSTLIHTNKRLFKSFLSRKNLIPILVIYSCASSSSDKLSNDLNLITDLSQSHFVGIGEGKGSSEVTAIKIARVSALGELSTNIKVHIKSRLDLYESENSEGETFESFSEKIIEIGQATVQSPEFDVISSNFNKKTKIFEVKILAKKEKRLYYDEVAQTISFNDTSKILRFFE